MRSSEGISSNLQGAILASRPSYKELKERIGKRAYSWEIPYNSYFVSFLYKGKMTVETELCEP